MYETYSDDYVQNRIETQNTTTNDDLMLKIDGESVLGVIKIDKIGFEGLIYEGTSLETLDKGIGHFESSPYLEGNVCLAGHNYSGVWKNLHTLENGDTITYTGFLGTKEYEVNNVTQISETDWTLLEDTEENYSDCSGGKRREKCFVINSGRLGKKKAEEKYCLQYCVPQGLYG